MASTFSTPKNFSRAAISLVVFFPAVALRQSDQAAFARRVDRAVLVAGREVDEDRVDVADIAWAADVVPQRAQLGDLGLVEPGPSRAIELPAVVTEMRGASTAC